VEPRGAVNRVLPKLRDMAAHRLIVRDNVVIEQGSLDCASYGCTTMVYTGAMPTTKQVRRSVTLPAQIAQQVERLAKRRRLSDNRVLVELIEQGIEATKQKEQMFFELAERFRSSKDPDAVKKLGDELGRFVFGE
jgi:hypothetical protein